MSSSTIQSNKRTTREMKKGVKAGSMEFGRFETEEQLQEGEGRFTRCYHGWFGDGVSNKELEATAQVDGHVQRRDREHCE